MDNNYINVFHDEAAECWRVELYLNGEWVEQENQFISKGGCFFFWRRV